jgi:hypothetical protein
VRQEVRVGRIARQLLADRIRLHGEELDALAANEIGADACSSGFDIRVWRWSCLRCEDVSGITSSSGLR